MTTNAKWIGIEEIEKKYGRLTFARVIRSHRLSEEISQVKFAKMLGVSKQGLNDLESGRKIPSLKRVGQIAKKINAHPAVLIQIALQDMLDKEKLSYKVKLIDTTKRAIKLKKAA